MPSSKTRCIVVGQDYVFSFDATTWGWIHLLLGILLVFAGFGVFAGQLWARTVGVLVAGLSAIGNFMFLFGLELHRSGRFSSSPWT